MGVIIACDWAERERQIEREIVSTSANKKINRKSDPQIMFGCTNSKQRDKEMIAKCMNNGRKTTKERGQAIKIEKRRRK